jgi:HTH-type transcriptional regulator, competence development regulator
MKTIGQIFRDTRKERELTLRQAAELLGIDFTYLSKIENDRSTAPGLELLSRFATDFSQDIDTLLLASGRLPEWMTARILEKPEVFYRLCRLSDEELERIFHD